MGLVDFPTRRVIVEGGRRDYVVARERIYGPDPNVPGARCLLYPAGAPVPLEQAVTLGLVDDAEPETPAPGETAASEPEAKAVEPTEGEDKAVKKPEETKASPKESPRRKTRAKE